MSAGSSFDLLALFISAFTSATIAPGSSEAVLAAVALQNERSDIALLAIATTGNSLGAMSTWWLGLWVARGKTSSKNALRFRDSRAWHLIQRFGPSALLLSWVPVIGDVLCFAAGWLRLPLLPSLVAVVTGKFLRYYTVLYLLHAVVQ